jgi:quaternary ammonium compound-resistance protein SugE
MAWLVLVVAGVFEVGWAIGLKYTHGFTRFGPTAWTLASMVLSFYLLAIAMRTLPVGTSYAVWVGVGAVGTVILGIALFDEPVDIGRIASLALIIAGIVGLRLSSPA